MTKTYLFLFCACLASWGCGEAQSPAAAETEHTTTQAVEADEAPSEPGVVRLSQEAVKRSQIKIGEVEERDLPDQVRAPAEVALNGDRTVHAAAFVEGMIMQCCKSIGSYVRKGEALAELHSHQTHELLAELRQAHAALEARRSELIYAEKDYERAQRLHELKAGSIQRVQETQTALDRARTAVESADAELAGSIAHFEYLGIDTTGLAEGRIPEHLVVHVRAPISGVIVDRKVALGTVVTPSDPLYEISDLSTLWLIARVPEQDLRLVKPGMKVDLTVKAYPERTFQGRVELIGDMLDSQTKTVQVRCVVTNPRRMLKEGMFGEALLRSEKTQPAVAVPTSAVQRIDDAAVVFESLGDNMFRMLPVQLGRSIDGLVEIVAGANLGQKIVTNGAFALKAEALKSRFSDE